VHGHAAEAAGGGVLLAGDRADPAAPDQLPAELQPARGRAQCESKGGSFTTTSTHTAPPPRPPHPPHLSSQKPPSTGPTSTSNSAWLPPQLPRAPFRRATSSSSSPRPLLEAASLPLPPSRSLFCSASTASEAAAAIAAGPRAAASTSAASAASASASADCTASAASAAWPGGPTGAAAGAMGGRPRCSSVMSLKFCSRATPNLVAIDSGWNWTP
jgi:hypothetical protein